MALSEIGRVIWHNFLNQKGTRQIPTNLFNSEIVHSVQNCSWQNFLNLSYSFCINFRLESTVRMRGPCVFLLYIPEPYMLKIQQTMHLCQSLPSPSGYIFLLFLTGFSQADEMVHKILWRQNWFSHLLFIYFFFSVFIYMFVLRQLAVL